MRNKIEGFCHSRDSIIDKNSGVCESYEMLAHPIYFVLFIENSLTFQNNFKYLQFKLNTTI